MSLHTLRHNHFSGSLLRIVPLRRGAVVSRPHSAGHSRTIPIWRCNRTPNPCWLDPFSDYNTKNQPGIHWLGWFEHQDDLLEFHGSKTKKKVSLDTTHLSHGLKLDISPCRVASSVADDVVGYFWGAHCLQFSAGQLPGGTSSHAVSKHLGMGKGVRGNGSEEKAMSQTRVFWLLQASYLIRGKIGQSLCSLGSFL